MTKLFLLLAFCISVVTLPWWLTFFLGIVYLSKGGSVVAVVIGGFIIDELYGAPIPVLHGFSFLYTGLALMLAIATLYFRTYLFE